MNIRQTLTERIDDWEKLGHPAMLDRFILRNGKTYTPAKRIGDVGKSKECFANATKFVMKNPGATYVEGFVFSDKLPWPFHHAWVSMNGTDAMDLTLDAEKFQYLGIAFDTDLVQRESIRNGVYGVLDPGLGFNTRLMFKIDPELESICRAVKRDPKMAALMQQAQEKAQ